MASGKRKKPSATKAEEEAAARRRSQAARKAAATRKRNEEAAAAQAQAQDQATAREVPEYQPRRQPLESAGLDQVAAEEKKQAELDKARKEHNVRTGNPVAPTGFKY